MSGSLRHYDLDPEFPFSAYEFVICRNPDEIHWHSHLQIALCLEGKGKFIFGNKEYSVSPGDIFVVDNFENHAALAEPNEAIVFLFIIFLPDLIAVPGSRIFDCEYLSPFWYDSKTFRNKIDANTSAAKEIAPIMHEIKKLWDEKDIGYKHLAYANLIRILGLLIKHYKITDGANSTTRIHSHIKIQPAINYINQHFTENITLEDVANIIHMSVSRFRHFFKEATGVSFKDYINYLRLNEAKKLLITTDLRLNEIVEKAGFSGTYHFYKKFYDYLSMTPNDYRKYYRDNVISKVIPKNGFDICGPNVSRRRIG